MEDQQNIPILREDSNSIRVFDNFGNDEFYSKPIYESIFNYQLKVANNIVRKSTDNISKEIINNINNKFDEIKNDNNIFRQDIQNIFNKIGRASCRERVFLTV